MLSKKKFDIDTPMYNILNYVPPWYTAAVLNTSVPAVYVRRFFLVSFFSAG